MTKHSVTEGGKMLTRAEALTEWHRMPPDRQRKLHAASRNADMPFFAFERSSSMIQRAFNDPATKEQG